MRADKSGKEQFKKYLGYPAKEYDLYPEKLYRATNGLFLPQERSEQQHGKIKLRASNVRLSNL